MKLENEYEISRYIRENSTGTRIAAKVLIRYRSESGRITDRAVSIMRYTSAYDGRKFLKAWCFLRSEERTFRIDRIMWMEVPEIRLTASCAAAQPHSPAAVPQYRAPASRPAAPRKKSRHLFFKAACLTIVILVARGKLVEMQSESYSTPSKAYIAAAKFVNTRQSPPAASAAKRTTAVSSFVRAPTPFERAVSTNTVQFTQATGISNESLIARYVSADSNQDTTLSWDEISAFQRRLDRSFSYSANDTALKPDEFLANGGGDCEDWSLVTAGLLRFWGFDPYVGSIRSPDSRQGHAVCLLRVLEKPSRHTYYHFDESGTFGGNYVPAGFYVPIDYTAVGSLTIAVGDGWELRHIYKPESIYGTTM